jgi:hypothetical protein
MSSFSLSVLESISQFFTHELRPSRAHQMSVHHVKHCWCLYIFNSSLQRNTEHHEISNSNRYFLCRCVSFLSTTLFASSHTCLRLPDLAHTYPHTDAHIPWIAFRTPSQNVRGSSRNSSKNAWTSPSAPLGQCLHLPHSLVTAPTSRAGS